MQAQLARARMTSSEKFNDASRLTAANLRSIAQMTISKMSQVSHLSLPEIDAVVDAVSRLIPAGNVPGMILSGMARLTGRRPPPNVVKRDIGLIFRGVEQALDKAVYRTFFAGPAAVIWGYQNLLKLVGRDPIDAFPEGVWQYYVTYALREDTARHANETTGFDAALRHHGLQLSTTDRIASWVMASIHTLHNYGDLLANEWYERIALKTLKDLTANDPKAAFYSDLYRQWEKQRPYGRGPDVEPTENYPQYRRRKFVQFLAKALQDLQPALRQTWDEQLNHATAYDLPAYRRQLTIIASLEPEVYSEVIEPMALPHAHIAVVWQGRYYLIPACAPGSSAPADSQAVRAQIAALLHSPSKLPPAQLSLLATVKRAALPNLVSRLQPETQQELRTLRCAPIIFNADQRPADLPLSEVRLTERGFGDHALTLLDTGTSMVFDQSHIFFDGAWGSALAEIMTNEALAWAVYFNKQAQSAPAPIRPYSPALQFDPAMLSAIAESPHISAESGAESTRVDLAAIQSLRRLMTKRNEKIRITVNDILVLYRSIHALAYRPGQALLNAISQLGQDPNGAEIANAITTSLEELQSVVPAILIPIDASQSSPTDRLHPLSIEVPLNDLQVIDLHATCLRTLETALKHTGNPQDATVIWEEFDATRRTYLATLSGVGEFLGAAKKIALSGQSASSSAIRLLGGLPQALQRMLDAVPSRFDVLNDIIKGREVFSNVGGVAPTSTLRRFITAKDDNDKKTLAWGAITDATGILHLSLRDFRPHVAALSALGRRDLALWITRDYLDAYVTGLNRYIKELLRITQTRRPDAARER